MSPWVCALSIRGTCADGRSGNRDHGGGYYYYYYGRENSVVSLPAAQVGYSLSRLEGCAPSEDGVYRSIEAVRGMPIQY